MDVISPLTNLIKKTKLQLFITVKGDVLIRYGLFEQSNMMIGYWLFQQHEVPGLEDFQEYQRFP